MARRRRWFGGTLVLAVFLGGLGGTWAAADAVSQVQQRHAAQLMDQYAEEVSQAVANETGRYHDTLSDLAASVGAQSDFTANDFQEITSRLDNRRLPGASSVSFSVPAEDDQVAGVQEFWRAQGVEGLQLAPVGTGLEHVFVVFNEPFDGSAPSSGRDVSQAPEPAEALRMSRDTGQVTASRTYVLLRDRAMPVDQQQMSFLLTAPVRGGSGTPDAGQFRGWITMGMRGGDFIDELLRVEARGRVSITLLDVSGGERRVVSGPAMEDAAHADPLSRERAVVVGQRNWQLWVQPTDALMTLTDQRMATLALWIGLLITLLLTAVVGVLAGARNRAMTRVDHATAALRDDVERRKTIEARLRERERDLQHLAFHDPLTGLANRTLFYERVEHAFVTHGRSRLTLAVLFIDLDGFKVVNDELGHSAGDAVLAEVAVRLAACVRESDTVARFGGDEFAVLAEQMAAPDEASIVADRIVRALRTPFPASGAAVITGSVGVALRPADGDGNGDDILRRADQAMYAAKVSGKDRYIVAEAPGREEPPAAESAAGDGASSAIAGPDPAQRVR